MEVRHERSVEQKKGGRPALIAKSPSSEKTLLTSSGTEVKDTNLLLAVSNLQAVSGLLMILFGVLCAVYGVAMSRLGAGVTGGSVALLSGLLGTLAALLHTPLYFTLYLALSLVSMAVNTLVLVLTLTAVVRDAQIDLEFLPVEDGASVWAGQWCGLGLLSATSLHLLATLVSLPLSCRRACSSPKQISQESVDTKQHMVRTWLGQQNLVLIAPQFLNEVGAPVYPMPCPPKSVTPVRQNMHQARRPPSRVDKTKRKEKKRELTEEELDRTYTGLDREIAEEFISIAMVGSDTPSSHRTS